MVHGFEVDDGIGSGFDKALRFPNRDDTKDHGQILTTIAAVNTQIRI